MKDDITQRALLSINRTMPQAGVRVVACRGEIDDDTAALLREALRVDDGGSRFILDLGAVTFLDSSGIHVLFAAHRDTMAAGGWLRIAAMNPTIQEVVQIVDLPTVIPCYPTLAQALNV
ncbi:STAS domain-containing protein [Streptomyces sp. NBC_01428]|uniref:STAS domain-containing protein n=1 Tax=Streptomyces sp. NBC_01428 TaxID=2903861 RepID=UPI002E31EEA2|nr:STAS domain-containing protein [Streptomyces sp. NBC_01428]